MRYFPLEGLFHPQHGIASYSEQQNKQLCKASQLLTQSGALDMEQTE